MKILTIGDLKTVRERAEKKLRLREQSDRATDGRCCGLDIGTEHMQVLICGGTGCKASSGKRTLGPCRRSHDGLFRFL